MTPLIREHHNAALAPAPSREVRKTEGIFYTPSWVADFIVDRAWRVWRSGFEARGIEPPSSPRILDPACGEGAFLLASRRRLGDDDRAGPRLFGVDTDARALMQAREALHWGSDLASEENIRVGDFLDDVTIADWEPFDLIVGNPPYRRERGHKDRMEAIASTRLGQAYRAPRMDLWHYFAHRALEALTPSGVLGLIVNSYWTASAGASKLIEALRSRSRILEIYDLEDMNVFKGVGGRHLILIARNGAADAAEREEATRIYEPTERSRRDPAAFFRGEWTMREQSAESLFRDGGVRIAPAVFSAAAERAKVPLGTLGRIRQGIAENPASINRRTNARFGERWTVGEGVFVLRPEEVERLNLPGAERVLLRPYHALSDWDRHDRATAPSLALIYATRSTWPVADDHPRLLAHLERFRPVMEERRETKIGRVPWHHLHWPRDEAIWQAPRKLLCKQMAARPSFAVADGPAYVSFSANAFVLNGCEESGLSLDYLSGWLNSRVMEDWFRREAKLRGAGPEINGHVLARAPVPAVDFADARQRAIHDDVAGWARRLSELNRFNRDQRNDEAEGEIRDLEARIDEWAARQV